jgi:uncharacterized protein
MKIEVDRLEEHGGKFSKRYDVGELSLGEAEVSLSAPANVSGRIRRQSAEVSLNGELRAEVETPCGRCLKPVKVPINTEFSERFVPAIAWRDDVQHELQSEDLDVSIFGGEVIDLDDLVREEILLAVPGHILCAEDCKGLCPKCGVDRNVSSCACEEGQVDSRWEKLKELQM